MPSVLRPFPLGSAAALALVVTLTGCSSGGSPKPSSGVGDVTAAAAKWGACMRDNGVQVEDPSPQQFSQGITSLPAGVDRATFDTASQKCAGKPEDRGVDDEHRATPENIAKWKKQAEAVTSCLDEHGVTGVPAPNDVGAVDFSKVDQENPAFKEWLPKCEKMHAPDTESLGL
ncbi:hypothetical protein [Frondihabitans sp. VKM Ac-2883]|uniref:hypothetical protein n=1 Tax=Frondihabitans sp. VKM Ac-2883 TaxID=2783823 RepID=UPI00188CDDBA|nr:hypothetical protein [Frondihabitans sp. VKM Ac-2883]MBF4574788.1 hypothetical protein [Frondihabitans sp. VKM Ac-2883]